MKRNVINMHSKLAISFLIIAILGINHVLCQETTSTPRRSHHHRQRGGSSSDRTNRKLSGNRTSLSTLNGNAALELADNEKYYEDNAGSDDDDYFYEEYEQLRSNETSARDYEEENEDKFIESGDSGIVLDHVEFVLLRLKHIASRVSSNITDILALQKKEFKINPIYKTGWDYAVRVFNETKRAVIFNNTSRYSIVRQVPIEYHIALIAYTSEDPNVYREFNKDTREICSGNHIDDYKWKSYFKLLQLAVETLGSREARWVDQRRFLYRGASIKFNLKEGQVLAFQHFISTSAELISAELFAGASLFEFQGYYNGTAMAIWDHSVLEHEREVLFSPTQVFMIDSIHVGKHYTRYVLVKHELPPPCDKKITEKKDGDDADDDAKGKLETSNVLYERFGSSGSRGKSEIHVAFLVSLLVVVFHGW